MKLKLFLLLVVLCFNSPLTASASECGIFVMGETISGARFMRIYAPENLDFTISDTRFFDALRGLEISPDGQRIAFIQYDFNILPYDEGQLNIFDLSNFSFELIAAATKLAPAFGVDVRPNAWSHHNDKVLLHNTYGNRNERLYVYDVINNEIEFPTDLEQVEFAAWSPDDRYLTFLAHDIDYGGDYGPLHFAVYVTSAEEYAIIKAIPVSYPDVPVRIQWLTSHELGLTYCVVNHCRLKIYELGTTHEDDIELGNYLVEAYVPNINSFLLSELPNRNLSLRDRITGDIQNLSNMQQVYSQPAVSPDGKRMAVTGELNEQIVLQVFNLAEPKLIDTVLIQREKPDLLFDNSSSGFGGAYGFYFEYETWNSTGEKLLYSDDSGIHIYDVSDKFIETIIPPPDETQRGVSWICP